MPILDTLTSKQILPVQHCASTVLALYLCLSVCPYVTSRCCIETAPWIEMLSGSTGFPQLTLYYVLRKFCYPEKLRVLLAGTL